MSNHPKLLNGQVAIKGVGQLMADNAWSAACIVTEHHSSHTDEKKYRVDGFFKSEQEAVNAGLHWGMKWVDATYPLER